MADSILSLIFPLHGIQKLTANEQNSPNSQNDKATAERIDRLNLQPAKTFLMLFGEDNM